MRFAGSETGGVGMATDIVRLSYDLIGGVLAVFLIVLAILYIVWRDSRD